MDFQQLMPYIVRVIVIFLVLPVHEFAHAWAANKMGDDTALYQGRLTMNPIAHIDVFGALCLLLTGFGWAKPVPINPYRFKNQRKGTALTALAGPMSNFLVALIAMIVYRIFLATPIFSELVIKYAQGESNMIYIFQMLDIFILINIGLGLFNLIPIPPLDGSKILSYFTSYKLDAFLTQYQMYISIAFIVLIYSGALSTPLNFLRNIVYDGFVFITNWVPSLMNMIIG